MSSDNPLENCDPDDPQDHSGFFVPADECLVCGCCHAEAPENFDWRSVTEKHSTTSVVRQPDNPAELSSMIQASANCMVNCIIYGGRDTSVIDKMRKAGVAPRCILHGK